MAPSISTATGTVTRKVSATWPANFGSVSNPIYNTIAHIFDILNQRSLLIQK